MSRNPSQHRRALRASATALPAGPLNQAQSDDTSLQSRDLLARSWLLVVGEIAGGDDDKFLGIDVAFHGCADLFRAERGDLLFEVSLPKHGAAEMAQAA